MATTSSPAATQVRALQETLLEFRAGKMALEAGQVRADPRKGLLRIVRGEEGVAHVQWVDRASLLVEDDHIIFPDEAVFEKVQQSTGRVYIMKFKHDDRKLFFWMQEPIAREDDELCSSVNFVINNPQSEPDEDSEEDPELPRMVPIPAKATPSVAPMSENTSRPVQLADLQRILSNLDQTYTEGASMFPRDPGPSLAEVLKPDNVLPLLENCQLEERLSPYLPEGEWTPHAIAELMQSPQFRQQLDLFSQALRSGQLDLAQFGIDPSQCDFTVASFLEAIENQVAAKPGAKDEASDRSRSKDMDEMDE